MGKNILVRGAGKYKTMDPDCPCHAQGARRMMHGAAGRHHIVHDGDFLTGRQAGTRPVQACGCHHTLLAAQGGLLSSIMDPSQQIQTAGPPQAICQLACNFGRGIEPTAGQRSAPGRHGNQDQITRQYRPRGGDRKRQQIGQRD